MMNILALVVASVAVGAVINEPQSGRSVPAVLPDGYREVQMSWTGPITPGGANVTFQGSLEDVQAQAEAAGGTILANSTKRAVDTQASVLDARQWDKDICNVGLQGSAAAQAIDSGISYLKGVTGDCGMPAGPGTCGRISCSYDSASSEWLPSAVCYLPLISPLLPLLYQSSKTTPRHPRHYADIQFLPSWCNDNNHFASWRCADFASYAQSVRDHCTFWTTTSWVWGQSFDKQNFNIMVGHDSC
ncbi:Uu.00g008480.m01.CDS01 [Anthostomella pinea]|uniref:Uu.00g008480.m01.CDS01 n=1 Tax=Anthostomella pinea TaxID=933095 RepID=A0AAI8VX67_9PEZI|nr:Uu.00g008480.m01.CDS01 [Anthostomella pinea]